MRAFSPAFFYRDGKKSGGRRFGLLVVPAAVFVVLVCLPAPLFSFCSSLSAAEKATASETGTSREKASVFPVVVEWVPPAIFESDGLTVVFCVHNNTTEPRRLRLTKTDFAPAGKKSPASGTEKKAREEVIVPPKEERSISRRVAVRGVSRVKFAFTEDGKPAGGCTVRLLRPEEPWPRTRCASGRLLDAVTGEILVPTTKRLIHRADRSWALLKAVLGDGAGRTARRADFRTAFLFLPGRQGRRVAGSSPAASKLVFDGLLPPRCRKAGRFCALGPYRDEGIPPIVLVVKTVALSLPRPAPRAVVLWLPADDLEAPTAPSAYRAALEHLLARLAQAGVKRLCVVPPLRYGVPEKRAELLRRAVRRAVAAYGASFAAWSDLRVAAVWRLDGAPGAKTEVYGARLNAAGREKAGKKLRNMIE